MSVLVEYSSNNSGGRWWLCDDDWSALEAAGWTVSWVKDDPYSMPSAKKTGRWLGALATSASKAFENPADAISEFERITHQDASDIGCNCCGPPHTFSYEDSEGRSHYASPEVTETSIGFD